MTISPASSASYRAEKSDAAFKTISEVAEELDIPTHVLRFWEQKFAHLTPLKRRGGRRYYRPEDVDQIRVIRTMLYEEGFTIRGAVRYFAKHGTRNTREIILDRERSVPPAPSNQNQLAQPSIKTLAAPQQQDARGHIQSALDALQEVRTLLEAA